VRGLVFFAFPLHPAGAPSDTRAAHLKDVAVPMLFLQGTRDALAELSLLKPVVKSLGKRATLVLADDADHSFHVPARAVPGKVCSGFPSGTATKQKSGRKDSDVLAELLDAAASWMLSV